MLGMIRNSLFGSVETWPWQVLSTGGKEEVSYEERACEGGKFATVEVTDKPVDEALREAMPKIMKYVGGTNDKGIGMGMTVPISFAVFPNEDGSLQKKLKVWFRIPNQFQSSPPVPSDESVKIEEREGITVYSKWSHIGRAGARLLPSPPLLGSRVTVSFPDVFQRQ
ncbi:heme-binding protein 1 isoform X2 [Peromyscus californicus insignis]|uniref:heme-binding protein 1 isoform X2 n=1 Tax=Peromyscus californicus insignis TaxID=564181 RepID=UPI0022A7F4E4|nr:heme-binding protein 1 isoform X2 [Peromyscus californicus insignis]